MINFFVTAAGQMGIRNYVAQRGAALAGRIQVVPYEDVPNLHAVHGTATIFAALDQIGPASLEVCSVVARQLIAAAPGTSILNGPRSLGRYALLRRCFDEGVNRFNAIRAVDDTSDLRYPVFVRFEARHSGSLTPLLDDRQALTAALASLRLRGIGMSQLLIVEFCDTAGHDGIYRKYSAMRIGDAIVPRHLHAGTEWMMKSLSSIVNEQFVREELAYLEKHPHERWLTQVFNIARIEYGRIDYGVWRGEPQVWEINTNPTLGRGGRRIHDDNNSCRTMREPGRLLSHQRMVEAFARLAPAGPVEFVPVQLDTALRERLRREQRAEQRAAARAAIVKRLLGHRLSKTITAVHGIRAALGRLAPWRLAPRS